MITTAERQYIEEVLGHHIVGSISLASDLTVQEDATVVDPTTSPIIHDVLVLTHPLDAEQRALLDKILGAVKLRDFTHLELESITPGELPEGTAADNVLVFTDHAPGKQFFANSPWWIMPPVAAMIGANSVVAANKKETWNWLQQFAKERA